MSRGTEVSFSFLLSIKAHLREIFENSDLSYSAAAQILGVDRATVRRWLQDNDLNCIDLVGMVRLSHHLKIPIQQLLPISSWCNGQQQIYGLTEEEEALAINMITMARKVYRSKRSRRAK